jgi:O-phospho-L-seryl-tRNASec:L-selenocysteinyl-tRNA synthase
MDSNTILNCFTQLGIPKSHSSHGLSNLLASSSQYRSLFLNRRLCDDGWSDVQIQTLLFTLSSLDTNNHHECLRRCGVGEREGRVYSSLVRNRHFGFSHGVGRSGDLAEPQPKAVGSTALARLTLYLTLDAVRRGSGLDKKTSANSGILLPLCTGMSIALTLRTFATLDSPSVPNTRGSETKNIVLWCRIDQKSCYKSILSAGFQCIIIPTKVVSDEVETNLDELRSTIQNIGKEKILAIISTTSCFAPRVS